MVLEEIVQPLVKWYRDNKRILPWRDKDNAYYTWVSEIIPVPFYQRPHNLFKYHNLSFPRLFTVHSILSNAAKIHFRLPVAIGFWPVCHFITKQKKTLIHKNKKDRTHFTVSRSFLSYSLFFTF